MDKIFASKFGLPEVTYNYDMSFHHDNDDPLCASSQQLTDFYDAVNPVDDNHPQRLNDIDVLNSVKDPDLKNAMLVALSKQSDGTEIDTSGMTDEQIAETALPQNVTYGQLYDAMQDVAELQSLQHQSAMQGATDPQSQPQNVSSEPVVTQTE